MEFNYKFYLSNYKDLQHFNEEEAYTHWVDFGMKEGRICNFSPINNTETNITIIIHLFDETLLNEFLEYIQRIKHVFKLVNVIFSINENSEIYDKILEYNFYCIKVENKGVDIYPFIKSFLFIKEKNIQTDFILKIHTKQSTNETEDWVNWRKDLIDPITNIKNLFVIQHYLKSVKNIGFIGSQKCILPKNYDLDFEQNIIGLIGIINRFPHLEKNWTDFVGGSIFWISYDVVNKYLTPELIQYLCDNFVYGKPPCNLTDKEIYVEYLCERLFTGVFCYTTTNIFVNNYNGTERGIVTDEEYFYQPSVFSFHNPVCL